MSAENNNPQDDFDFFDVLLGRTYPKDSVTVTMDEEAVYEFIKATRQFDETADHSVEEIQAQEKLVNDLHDRITKAKVTFELQGIPDDEIAACKTIADEHFAPRKRSQKTADGRIVQVLPEAENISYMNYFTAVVFSKHILSMHRHRDGRTVERPSIDVIDQFMQKAPGAAKEKLTGAINALRMNSADYEAGLDEGFFPKS